MTLPDDYFTYPKRGHGQDIDRHDWRLAKDRTPISWPGGQAVAVMMVIPCEFYPLNPTNKPIGHPRGMKTPYPDLRHYTTRDYGNRVGVYRLLDVLGQAGLRGTFPISAALLDKAPPLVEAILDGGHEIAAAGLHTDAIHWGGMDAEAEAQRVSEVRGSFDKHGLTPSTWMSPARNQSRQTLDILADNGFTRCLDWETDQVPLHARTASGSVLTLPVHNELEDAKLILDRRQSEDRWAEQINEAVDFLKTETDRYGSQMLSFQITPFVMGQPFRVHAFKRLVDTLASDKDLWCATASDIAASFEEQVSP